MDSKIQLKHKNTIALWSLRKLNSVIMKLYANYIRGPTVSKRRSALILIPGTRKNHKKPGLESMKAGGEQSSDFGGSGKAE